MSKNTFSKIAKSRNVLAEREETKQELGFLPARNKGRVHKKKSKVEKESAAIKAVTADAPVNKATRSPLATNSREGKSKEWIEQIERLERQAELNRPLINLPKEKGKLISGRKSISPTFTANDTDIESEFIIIFSITNEITDILTL